jgi:hypothetical protein
MSTALFALHVAKQFGGPDPQHNGLVRYGSGRIKHAAAALGLALNDGEGA